jgi:hypothetical protein
MIEKINERVKVLTSFYRAGNKLTIHKIEWNGRVFVITSHGYDHKVREGRNLIHYFHVSTHAISFKLRFDPEFLTWHVVEVSDGNPN